LETFACGKIHQEIILKNHFTERCSKFICTRSF